MLSHHSKLMCWLKERDFIITFDSVGIEKRNRTVYYVMALMVIKMVIMKMKEYQNRPIYPITLIGTTIYAKFIEQLLIVNKIPYMKVDKPYFYDLHYYTASRGKTVAINPSMWEFNNELTPLIGLNRDEIVKLEQHTGFKDLHKVQEQVLSLLPEINGYHIVRENYLDSEKYDYKILKPKDDVITSSKLIISDTILPLMKGEILGCYYVTNDNIIATEEKYIVNEYHHLESLRGKRNDQTHLLPFYTIIPPRKDLILHPFHFPPNKDPILTLLIITQAMINLV